MEREREETGLLIRELQLTNEHARCSFFYRYTRNFNRSRLLLLVSPYETYIISLQNSRSTLPKILFTTLSTNIHNRIKTELLFYSSRDAWMVCEKVILPKLFVLISALILPPNSICSRFSRIV